MEQTLASPQPTPTHCIHSLQQETQPRVVGRQSNRKVQAWYVCGLRFTCQLRKKKGRGGRAEGRCGGSLGCFLAVAEQFNQTSKGTYINYSIFLKKLNTERYGGGAGPQRCQEVHVILRTETDHQETS